MIWTADNTTLTLLILATVAVLTFKVIRWVGAPAAAAAEPPVSWLEQATTSRLVVHTTEGKSIEGTLALAAADGVILRSAVLLEPGRSVPMAGEVWVPRGQVLFVQTKPPG